MTISWIYRYWCDIVEFFIFAFDDARYSGIGHFIDDDWHLNIFLILPILSISSFFSVAHDMMISIIFLQLTMWPYSALGLIILLLMTSTINPRFMTISSYSAFLCSLTISRIFRFISFPLIYLDFVHFRRFPDNQIDEFCTVDIPDLSLIPLRHH